MRWEGIDLVTDEGALVMDGGESAICKCLNMVDHESSSAMDEPSLDGRWIGIDEARIPLPPALIMLGLCPGSWSLG